MLSAYSKGSPKPCFKHTLSNTRHSLLKGANESSIFIYELIFRRNSPFSTYSLKNDKSYNNLKFTGEVEQGNEPSKKFSVKKDYKSTIFQVDTGIIKTSSIDISGNKFPSNTPTNTYTSKSNYKPVTASYKEKEKNVSLPVYSSPLNFATASSNKQYKVSAPSNTYNSLREQNKPLRLSYEKVLPGSTSLHLNDNFASLDEEFPLKLEDTFQTGNNLNLPPTKKHLIHSGALHISENLDKLEKIDYDSAPLSNDLSTKEDFSTAFLTNQSGEKAISNSTLTTESKHPMEISLSSPFPPRDSFTDRFCQHTGIKRHILKLYCSEDNGNNDDGLICSEYLFDNLTKASLPLISSKASSFNSPLNTKSSIHDLSVLERKKFFIPKDQLIPSKNSIKLVVDTVNNIIDFIPRSNRGIFGINSLSTSTSDTLLVLFNDPLSAMLLHQNTKIPAISLPVWVEDSLQLRYFASLLSNSFSKVILVCNCSTSDFDFYSSLGPIQQHFSTLLQRWRCYIVPIHSILSQKSTVLWKSLKCLFESNEIGDQSKFVLDNAIPVPSKNIINTSKYLGQVRNEISLGNQALWGVPLKWSLPELTQIMKGLRDGELTILTGPTGSGKTTILSQLSLDWCEQGVPTLWGSFEIPNHRIIKKMMIQRRGSQFSEVTASAISEFEQESESFTKLPLYFMNFFGSSSPFSDVLETMAWAVQKHSIKHVILDNLQFMTSGHGVDRNSNSFSKFDYSDRVISEVRRFATETNCHITLVIHPRKEQDNTVLGICSISGTAKATQEADNVFILQKMGKKRSIDVRKNRFDGELGRVYYSFDPNSLRISALNSEDHPVTDEEGSETCNDDD